MSELFSTKISALASLNMRATVPLREVSTAVFPKPFPRQWAAWGRCIRKMIGRGRVPLPLGFSPNRVPQGPTYNIGRFSQGHEFLIELFQYAVR